MFPLTLIQQSNAFEKVFSLLFGLCYLDSQVSYQDPEKLFLLAENSTSAGTEQVRPHWEHGKVQIYTARYRFGPAAFRCGKRHPFWSALEARFTAPMNTTPADFSKV